MNTTKWLSAVLALVMLIAGPLALATASAQTPVPPPPPPPGAPAPIVSPPYEPSEGAKIGAGFLNVVYVPGKAILCGSGSIASAAIMLLTFGNAYRAAVEVFNEGCGGKWKLTPYDVAGRTPPDDRAY